MSQELAGIAERQEGFRAQAGEPKANHFPMMSRRLAQPVLCIRKGPGEA